MIELKSKYQESKNYRKNSFFIKMFHKRVHSNDQSILFIEKMAFKDNERFDSIFH